MPNDDPLRVNFIDQTSTSAQHSAGPKPICFAPIFGGHPGAHGWQMRTS
jgi:hypothetical protein